MGDQWVTLQRTDSIKGKGSLEYSKGMNSLFIAFDMGWVRITKKKRRAVVVGTEMSTVHLEKSHSQKYLIDFLSGFFLFSIVSCYIIRALKVTAYIIKISSKYARSWAWKCMQISSF